MNKSDSERIAAVLENIGYKKAPEIEKADLIIVNMCSIRQSAVDRVYGKIKDFTKFKTQNTKLKTVLTGCILRKDRKKFAQYFDYILNIKNLPFWPQILLPKSKNRNKPPRCTSGWLLPKRNYFGIEPKNSNFPSALVPISNGCNNFCTYCVVPYTRGPEICRPAKEILSEVKNLIKKNYKEIWLLGQNVNSYKDNKNNVKFTELLRMIDKIPGKFWIRFTSPHPKDFSDELIEIMAQCRKISPYLNLPVQSGNNKILRKMQRGYTIKQYKNLVKKIREKIPDITLSTDVIVGFPGETEKQFINTEDLFREIKFDMAYISQYSPRPGTARAALRGRGSFWPSHIAGRGSSDRA